MQIPSHYKVYCFEHLQAIYRFLGHKATLIKWKEAKGNPGLNQESVMNTLKTVRHEMDSFPCAYKSIMKSLIIDFHQLPTSYC